MGLMVISICISPHTNWIRLGLAQKHGYLGTSGQESRRRDIAPGGARSCYALTSVVGSTKRSRLALASMSGNRPDVLACG